LTVPSPVRDDQKQYSKRTHNAFWKTLN